MPGDNAKIQADFGRIALLTLGSGWDHNSHYHDFLLRHLPPHLGDVLEVGSGKGDFARLLSSLADRVPSLDLSPQMIGVASEQSAEHPNIRFELADVMTWDAPPDSF